MNFSHDHRSCLFIVHALVSLYTWITWIKIPIYWAHWYYLFHVLFPSIHSLTLFQLTKPYKKPKIIISLSNQQKENTMCRIQKLFFFNYFCSIEKSKQKIIRINSNLILVFFTNFTNISSISELSIYPHPSELQWTMCIICL